MIMENTIIEQRVKEKLKQRINDVLIEYQSGKIEEDVKKELKKENILSKIKRKGLITNPFNFLRYRLIPNDDTYRGIMDYKIKGYDDIIRFDFVIFFFQFIVSLVCFLLFRHGGCGELLLAITFSPISFQFINYKDQYEKKLKTTYISIILRLAMVVIAIGLTVILWPCLNFFNDWFISFMMTILFSSFILLIFWPLIMVVSDLLTSNIM